MPTKKPVKEEEWAAFYAANHELAEKMKKLSQGYYDLSDMEFKNSLADMNKEQLEAMMAKMKSEMAFYKKVVNEPYYKEHPEKKNTHRFEDSMRKAKSINSKGKIIQSVIANL